MIVAGRRAHGVFAATMVMLLGAAMPSGDALAARYPWRSDTPAAAASTLAGRVPPPAGFKRIAVAPGSFGEWLRGLPLKAADAPVHLYDGRPKTNQDIHIAVIDIDTGSRDLQQFADAVMRLRAEYLLGSGRARDIAFNYT